MAELLLVRGAHTDFPAVMDAVLGDAPAHILQLLLQHETTDIIGRALFMAAQARQQYSVHILLEFDEQSKGNRRVMAGRLEAAVCGAASQGRLELLQFLLTPLNRFLPGPADAMGRHTLKQVLSKGLEAAVLGQQYEWDTPQDDQQYPYLSIPRSAHRPEEVVAFLLQQGADSDYGDGKLLLLAVQQQQGAVLHQLLEAGATKINLALVKAAACGDGASITRLLSAINGPVDQAGAALLSAAQGGHVSEVAMLLERGANVTAALHAAAVHGNATAVPTILSYPGIRVTDRVLQQELLALAARKGSLDLVCKVGIACGIVVPTNAPGTYPTAASSAAL
jgi:hypothetical protein